MCQAWFRYYNFGEFWSVCFWFLLFSGHVFVCLFFSFFCFCDWLLVCRIDHILANLGRRPDTSVPELAPHRATWQMSADNHEEVQAAAHLGVQRGGRTKSHRLLRYARPQILGTF